MKDSVSLWMANTNKVEYQLDEKKFFLKKAYLEVISAPMDTMNVKLLSKIAYKYLKLKDTTLFLKLNKEAYQYALEVKDTFTLADIHWSKANFYKGKEVFDSAYYHYNEAFNLFEVINEQYNAAKMLYGMAFIRGRYRDYSGSEILIIKAIEKNKVLKKYKDLYASYEHLAVLYEEMEDYDRALFYHDKALKYLDNVDVAERPRNASLNNIGLLYLKMGQYNKALKYFDKILDDNLKIKDIAHYARVLDNRAYCKLLYKDTVGIKQDFYASLKIRDSLGNLTGMAICSIHLSEYYSYVQDTVNALKFAKKANTHAGEVKNSRDYLASLNLLSRLDMTNSKSYLKKYIAYSDSLQEFDRKIQNKFTRIEYETDEYIQETKRLAEERIRILVISLGVLFLSSLLYYIHIQRTRNEKLRLVAKQQQATEQLYILTLQQHSKLEKEKSEERNRISEELHDGILGMLFGARIGLGFLKLNGDVETLKQYYLYIDKLQYIEKEIREVSHRLNSNIDSAKVDFESLVIRLIKDKSELGDFKYKLTLGKELRLDKIDEIIKVNLYRIIQEATQNIVKYAHAKNISIEFFIYDENLHVNIKDDGIGFNTGKSKKGIGIKNIMSRVQKLKGNFAIHSELGNGTIIHIIIPIKQ